MIKYVSLILVMLLASVAKGQLNHKTKTELAFGVSILSSYTDIGGANGQSRGFPDFRLSEQRPAIMAAYKYNFNSHIAIRGNARLGVLSNSDKGSRNADRGFAFNSPILEFTVIGQYYLVKEREPYYYSSTVNKGRTWSRNVYPAVYLNAGLGCAFYAVIQNNRMSESSQDGIKGGKIVTPVFPVGLGFNYPIAKDARFFGEFHYIFTLTDYLDGYDNPKYSKSNDMYFALNLGIIYQFGDKIFDWKKTKIKRD